MNRFIIGVLFLLRGAELQEVRALVVDDFERWRRIVCATLRSKLGLCIIEEAADGLDAVWKAEALQPDLIVLDIGLPTMNGIEVARKVRKVSPKSRVVFFTQNASCDIAEATLHEGASGYVLKAAASRELTPAVKAALEGRQFVSAGLRALTLRPEMVQ